MSNAMAAKLREKPGGEDIGVTIGDFATTTVDGTFSLAYLVFNTISNLTTQAAQVACFRNVAAHLEPGGCFVIEVGVPEPPAAPARRDLPRLPRERDRMGDRRVRRREPGPHLSSLRARRRETRAQLGSLPVHVARGARPDGTACRDEPARALERVEAGAVHERQPQARLGLGEAPRLSRSRSAVLPGRICTRTSTGWRPSWSTASPGARPSATWRRSHTSRRATHSRQVAAEVEQGRRLVLAAFLDGDVVGTVQVVFALPPNQPHRAEIAKLLVDRSARRRGLA